MNVVHYGLFSRNKKRLRSDITVRTVPINRSMYVIKLQARAAARISTKFPIDNGIGWTEDELCRAVTCMRWVQFGLWTDECLCTRFIYCSVMVMFIANFWNYFWIVFYYFFYLYFCSEVFLELYSPIATIYCSVNGAHYTRDIVRITVILTHIFERARY